MLQKLPSDPRARMRLRWIQHYHQITKKVSPTCRYFGISRGTFYTWYHRYLSRGADKLLNKACRPHRIHRWLPFVDELRVNAFIIQSVQEVVGF